ncbi:MAG: DUF2294 domain-containing protein [Caldilineaceae bacterium]|nr:DUF2294 domain-containing protein [Caldilineaceae bacterium]
MTIERKRKTRGMVEAEFTRSLIQFEKEHLGRGPADVRTYLLSDMAVVRMQGILTPAEQKLSATAEGRDLVKEMRRQLFENSRDLLEAIVDDVLGCRLVSLHTDMSTVSGERMVVFIVDADLDVLYPAGRR